MTATKQLQETADPERERAVEATAWFSQLMHARRVRDDREVATAYRRLSRLGVEVEIRPVTSRGSGA